MQDKIRILFFGDIVGKLGRSGVKKYLDLHKKQDKIDFVIANGENTTHGHGLSLKHYNELLSYGIDCITSGNHFFNLKENINNASSMKNFIRPFNLDKNCPGVGTRVFTVKDTSIRVSNFIGRVFMQMAQTNPYYDAESILNSDQESINIIDFHAEATAEKRTFAHYLDGKATAILGTHTHVQTNDCMILENGTLFMSDVGMNGALFSSLGDDQDLATYRTMTGMPATLEVVESGKTLINALLFDVSAVTKKVIDYKIIKEIYEI